MNQYDALVGSADHVSKGGGIDDWFPAPMGLLPDT